MPHLELKFLEFVEAPLVSINLNYVRLLFQEWLIREEQS